MKKANLVLMAAMAAAGMVGVAGGSLVPATAVAASKEKAPPAHQISASVRKPLVAAQEAINAKNWDEALTQVQAALAVSDKTPYDEYQINDFAWFIYAQKQQYAESAATLEKVVNSGFVPEDALPQRYKVLEQLNLQIKNYDKAIEFGNKYLAVNPTDEAITLQVGQAMSLKGDFQGAKTIAQKLITGAAKPSEASLLLLLRSNYELKDDAGTYQALEGLVRYYPQPKYWEDLINNQLFRTKDDRALRYLFRLMDATNTLDKSDEYAEMANSLITGGFPTEAKQILERGLGAGAFQGDAKTRAQSDLDRATKLADADRKDLPGAEKALAAAKTGNEMVATGKLYFSVGDYAKAADAIQKGLAKGGVTDVADSNMLLGVALARSGKPDEARKAFAAVQDPKLAQAAHLWTLKLDSDANAAAGAAPTSG